MAQLQYIFSANPKKKSKRSGTVAKKKKKKSAHGRRKAKKNPMQVTVTARSKYGKKKVVQKKKSKVFADPYDVKKIEIGVAKASVAAKRLKGKKNRGAKKKLRAAAKKGRAVLKGVKAHRKAQLKEIKEMKEMAKGGGYKVSTKTNYFGGSMAKKRRKKKSSAKRRKKRKVVKTAAKKVRRKKRRSKKAKTVKTKSTKRRKSRRRKSRKSKKSVSVSAPKTSKRRKSRKSRRAKRMVTVKGSFMGKFKRNPIGGGGKGWRIGGHYLAGYDLLEVASLAVGGGLYGAINGAIPKIPGLGQVQAALMRIPVVGTGLTPMLVGVALNVVADKFIKNSEMKKYVSILGDGLVGASVVGMGVNASQYIPMLSPNMSGLGNVQYTPGGRDTLGNVQYFPGMGILPQGLGDSADFGGVNYTPNMSGVEYFPGMGSDADFGANPDFGASADFGITPEGLGSEGDYSEQMS